MNRQQYADLILKKLAAEEAELKAEFATPGLIQSCIVDDLLPSGLAMELAAAFPKPEEMKEQKSIREHKYTAKQLNRFNPVIEEITFAFQDPRILEATSRITGLEQLDPDPFLYAGGISLMAKENFLLPHLWDSRSPTASCARTGVASSSNPYHPPEPARRCGSCCRWPPPGPPRSRTDPLPPPRSEVSQPCLTTSRTA